MVYLLADGKLSSCFSATKIVEKNEKELFKKLCVQKQRMVNGEQKVYVSIPALWRLLLEWYIYKVLPNMTQC